MFHFLSDLTTPAPSASGPNMPVTEENTPQESSNTPKRKRGRPKKSVKDVETSLPSEQMKPSTLDSDEQSKRPSQGSPTIIKSEPVDNVTSQRKRKRKTQIENENCNITTELLEDNNLSRDSTEGSNGDSVEVVRNTRGRRKAATSVNTSSLEETAGTNKNTRGVQNNRRKRKLDNSPENEDLLVAGNENDEDLEEKEVVKQKKAATSNKKTSAKHSSEPEEEPTNAIVVKCACCQEEMESKSFSKHNLSKHNNLGWIEGEQPTDLYDERTLMTTLKRVLKQTKKKYLVCDTCGVEKKSCLGYITHKRVCGKSAEERYNMQVACELCGRKMMPVSMKSHMASHARPKLDGFIIESGRKRAAANKAKSRLTECLNDDGSAKQGVSVPVRKKLLFTSPKPRRAPSKFIGKWKSELMANNPAKCFNVDCPFETDNVETMKEHYKVCEFATENSNCYECLLCVFKCEEESSMKDHISTDHPDGYENAVEVAESGSDVDLQDMDDPVSEEYDSDDDDSRRRIRVRPFLVKSKRPCHRFRFLAKEDLVRASALDSFSPTLMWTLQYRMENESPSLFHEFLSNEDDWQLVPLSEIDLYLPVTRSSVHVAFGDIENGLRFNLFDSTVVDDSSVMFVGGPVWSSAWCPLPLELSVKTNADISQFLAVSCHREMDAFHGIYSCYTGPNVIQLWECGPLSNTVSPEVPKLALAITHDFGTVWRMEWCPSGAYGTSVTGKLRRLGLLAAACSDGFVHIFSVCFPSELQAHIKPNQAPIYSCKPVLTLKPNSPELTQCTRVSWHRGKGHGLIAGGFCDGKVALWNLENYSSLLYNKEDREMYPYHTFQAHYSVVSALSLCPEGQYLMTGSRDCSVKFWDLEDTTAPVTVTRKGLVTDGAWLSHWMCAMTTYDDAYLHEHSNATLIPIREFGFKPYPVLPQNSVAWCLSESAWMNSLVQGSLAGEVALNIAGQLFLGLDNEKFPTRKRLLVCFTELRELLLHADGKEGLGAEPSKPTQIKEKEGSKSKDKADVEEIPGENTQGSSSKANLKPRDYKDTSEKYGINIVNFLNFKTDQVPAEVTQPMRQSNAMNQVHSEMYPITSINQVQWNPNLKSCLWLAIGHQCGLIRLVCLKYMHSTTLMRFYNKAEAVVKRTHPSVD